jgi:uncharacterized protein
MIGRRHLLQEEEPMSRVGRLVWTDLTVADAPQIRDFYAAVIGWTPEPVDMGGYHDFNMLAPESDGPVVGICHARGANTDLGAIPPAWLVYIEVADVAAAARLAVELGGEVLAGPRPMGLRPFCVIRDPAGAVAALIESTPDAAS